MGTKTGHGRKTEKKQQNRDDRAQRYKGVNAGKLDTWHQDDLAKKKEMQLIYR